MDPDTLSARRNEMIRRRVGQGYARRTAGAGWPSTFELFVWNGEQVDVRAVQTMLRQHCSIADLPVVPLQAMRQACVVAAIDSGIPVKQISERLGHSVEPQTLWASPRANKPTDDGPQRIAKSQTRSW